ncbi:dihydrofolate reductase [Mortierella alpina]|uniref:Dihydrofolate reductase n=1 Tax=Mortierella alpina TaxID=64518 RepID=A0A9P6JAD8_MORAP|nr:dihydrofolate reductase [Mortierella alpina]
MSAFSIVVAADQASGIGLKGGLPWRLRKDMAFFANVTSTVPATTTSTTHSSSDIQRVNACIMGRRTWESIPAKFRPLVNRFNVIVSRDPHYLDDKPEKNNPMVALATSFQSALELAETYQRPRQATETTSPSGSAILIERVFLIGGGQLYTEGIESAACQHIFLTRIHTTVECDAFFPAIQESDYTVLPSKDAHSFLQNYVQDSIEEGTIVEGAYHYEYTVYNRI